ncbi:MAG: TetR/AcrR family transcriptional regulator C-terminal domain-containing protein [Lachnospiraceae bacterium]|nr:TetR/AcrR family transcriptional regulator C-terminal domain-containing protein [Lachnospiraceae bacterium]MDD3617646.1 TetR/AcrR family transcriptional regulator C-terminal domain-containing protein [Lachnospiraceae bacterium]
MNTANNKRRRASCEKIEKAFMELIQSQELSKISVSEICKITGLNRTTFYSNYTDIYELADKVKKKLEDNIDEMYKEELTVGFNSNDYLRLFRHIYDNQLFYKTYYKLGYTNEYKIVKYDMEQAEKHFQNKHIEYHCEFFRAGITKIIEIWLDSGCKESPEELDEIIRSEYRGRE